MKAVAARETEATSCGTARRGNRGFALSAPGHRMPAVAQRQADEGIGTVLDRTAQPTEAAEAAPRANTTGLPDQLKSGVETLSGLSMDDVRVHYNSPRPAQLQALAYAQGADIHVSPGQEEHLPHEAWHVVQQKQGRVRATLQMKGAAINDDGGLEREADAMGARALQAPAGAMLRPSARLFAPTNAPIQRRVGFEFESNIGVGTLDKDEDAPRLPPKQAFYTGSKWHVEPDRDHMEFVTQPLSSSDEVFATMDEIVAWVKDLLSVPIQLPLAEIGKIRRAAREERDKAERQKQDTLKLQQRGTFVEDTARGLDVPKATVEEWIKQAGILAVNEVVLHAKTYKEVGISFTNAVSIAARSLAIETPDVYEKSEAEEIERNALRPLDQKKIKAGMKPGLAALGNVQQVSAAPQATTGVTLDKLINAMHLIPKEEVLTGIGTPQEATRTLSGNSPEDGALLVDARGRAIAAVKPLRSKVEASEKQWREFEGVLALMISYVRKGNQPRDVAFEDAKLIAPLMSRVNFTVMYGALAPPLRALFQPAMIAAAAGYPASNKVFGDKGFGKHGKGPTIEEWVVSIARGDDWMSLVGKKDVVTDKQSGSPSMGQYAQLDKHDKLAPQGLVPLELRRIPKNIPLADWTMLAYQIFIMAEAMLTAEFD